MKKLKQKASNIWLRLFNRLIKWTNTSIKQVLVMAVLILGLIQYTGFKWDKSMAKEIDKNTPLLSNEDARMLIDTMRQMIAIQEKGKDTKIYMGVRKATATQLDTGEIKLDIPTRGFTLEPGFVLGAGESLRVGADIQYAYWKRWGLIIGGTVPVHTRRIDLFRGHVGLSYSPYFRFVPNTSVWGGIDSNKSPIFGLRTRLKTIFTYTI